MTSHDKLTLVVLAAGAGSRYRGLKQLVPVGPCGETLLEYAAFDALRSGFERIVLVVTAEIEESFRRQLDGGLAARAQVDYAHQRIDDLPSGVEVETERVRPWGTGQAVLAAGARVDGQFAVVNADDFYGLRSYIAMAEFLRTHGRRGRTLGVIGFPVRQTLTEAGAVSRATLRVSRAGELEEIVELAEVWKEGGRIIARTGEGDRKTLIGNELVSMNMWGFTPEFLVELERRFRAFLRRSDRDPEAELVLPEVVGECVRDGSFRVDVLPARCVWFGMTFIDDRPVVARRIAELVDAGEYPESLWA